MKTAMYLKGWEDLSAKIVVTSYDDYVKARKQGYKLMFEFPHPDIKDLTKDEIAAKLKAFEPENKEEKTEDAKVCPICGGKLTNGKKYCSKECYQESRKQ